MKTRIAPSRKPRFIASALAALSLLAGSSVNAQGIEGLGLILASRSSESPSAEAGLLVLLAAKGISDASSRIRSSRASDNDRSPAQEPIGYASSADGAGYCADENGHAVYYYSSAAE